MRTIPELEMNFRAMSEPYTPADEKLLFVMNEQIRPDYCRMCYECKGQCPKGMPVTEVLRFLAYHDFCGNYHQAVVSFRDLAKEVRDVRCSDCSPAPSVPEWSACPGSTDSGAGAFGITVFLIGLCGKATSAVARR